MNTTQRRRLEKAGYVPVQVGRDTVGWVPAAYAARVIGQIEAHRQDVAALADQPPLARGRPRKDVAKAMAENQRAIRTDENGNQIA